MKWVKAVSVDVWWWIFVNNVEVSRLVSRLTLCSCLRLLTALRVVL